MHARKNSKTINFAHKTKFEKILGTRYGFEYNKRSHEWYVFRNLLLNTV